MHNHIHKLLIPIKYTPSLPDDYQDVLLLHLIRQLMFDYNNERALVLTSQIYSEILCKTYIVLVCFINWYVS